MSHVDITDGETIKAGYSKIALRYTRFELITISIPNALLNHVDEFMTICVVLGQTEPTGSALCDSDLLGQNARYFFQHITILAHEP